MPMIAEALRGYMQHRKGSAYAYVVAQNLRKHMSSRENAQLSAALAQTAGQRDE